MIKVSTLVNEAIGVDVVRAALDDVDVWDYKSGFSKEFDGNFRKVIATLPPDTTLFDEHPLYIKLEDLFTNQGYILTIDSYIKGYVTKNKQQMKIGKLLIKMGKDNYADAFRDDPLRQQNKNDYMIVVSKHPYDVLGASTDRNWTSCTDMGGSGIVYKQNSIEGINADVLSNSLENPYFVAYLVDPDDRNSKGKVQIKRPLSRILIYPFKSQSDDTYNWAIGDMYGLSHNGFYSEVYDWVTKLNESYVNANGVFQEIGDSYYDSYMDSMVKTYLDYDELMDKYTYKYVDIGTYVEEQRGENSLYDIRISDWMDADLNDDFCIKNKEFFNKYTRQAIERLVKMLPPFENVLGWNESNFEIYEYYTNGSVVHLNALEMTYKTPDAMMNEHDTDEDELVSKYGSYGTLGLFLEDIQMMDNVWDTYKHNLSGNMSNWMADITTFIGDSLVEIGANPDIKNWKQLDEVDSSMIEDQSWDLMETFSL